jgi:hypothetical protein
LPLSAPPYPWEWLKNAHHIAIVGNGPVSDPSRIDEADLVVRFNKAPHCGEAGRRTDILVLVNWSGPGLRFATGRDHINELAQKTAHSFWLTADPKDLPRLAVGREWNARGDYSRRIVKRIVGDRPYRYMTLASRLSVSENLRMHGGRDDVIPSSGAHAIEQLLCDAPLAELVLYGFSHSGWEGHSWQAERRWVDSLERVSHA